MQPESKFCQMDEVQQNWMLKGSTLRINVAGDNTPSHTLSVIGEAASPRLSTMASVSQCLLDNLDGSGTIQIHSRRIDKVNYAPIRSASQVEVKTYSKKSHAGKPKEIEISDDDNKDVSQICRTHEKKGPDFLDELTTNESSTKLYNLMRRQSPNNLSLAHDLSEQDLQDALNKAKKRMLSGSNVVEIDISDDEKPTKKKHWHGSKNFAAARAPPHHGGNNQNYNKSGHLQPPQHNGHIHFPPTKPQKPLEIKPPAQVPRPAPPLPDDEEIRQGPPQKNPIVPHGTTEERFLKQLSGVYKSSGAGNRLNLLLPKESKVRDSFASRYKVLETLGEGGSCVVRKVSCLQTLKIFAVKSCKEHDSTSIEYIRRELKILRMLCHANIIKTYGVFESTSNVHYYLSRHISF